MILTMGEVLHLPDLSELKPQCTLNPLTLVQLRTHSLEIILFASDMSKDV